MLAAAELVTITERIATCRDPTDDKFLELAVNGHADLIVSGDRDLLAFPPACISGASGAAVKVACPRQIEMSVFLPFRNVTVGWGRAAGGRGAPASRSARPAHDARTLEAAPVALPSGRRPARLVAPLSRL
jgi:PIN domain-containing protein